MWTAKMNHLTWLMSRERDAVVPFQVYKSGIHVSHNLCRTGLPVLSRFGKPSHESFTNKKYKLSVKSLSNIGNLCTTR